MAIHAKRNGLMIGGKIIDETESNWIFQARDNKRPTVVSKSDPKKKTKCSMVRTPSIMR